MAGQAKDKADSGSRLQRVLYRLYCRHAKTSGFWRRRFTTAGWLAVIMGIVTATVGLDTNHTTAYQIFSLLAVLGAFAILSGIFFRPRLTIERDCPRFASVGTAFSYRVSVRNPTRRRRHSLRLRESLPPPIPPRDAFLRAHEPGEDERNRFDRTFLFYRWIWLREHARQASDEESRQFAIAPGADTDVAMTITPLRRGILELGDMQVVKTDPFGLIKAPRPARARAASGVTVLPKRYPIPSLALAGRSQYQPCGVALAGNVGQSDEFMGLREYRPGDPIRHLHWKSWARLGIPIVREFEDEFFPRYALALDTFARYDHDNIFEEAVSVAASFACTLDTKESLLDLMFVGAEAYCFTSGRGTAQPERLLEVLAAVELCTERPFDDLDNLVRAHARDLSVCICVLIDWDEQRQAYVQRLRASGIDVLAIVVCAPGDPRIDHPTDDGVRFLESSGIAEGLAAL